MLFLGVKGQEKRPEILEISGLGGDKRDRTADLLNAIQALSRADGLPPLLSSIIFVSYTAFFRIFVENGEF